MNTDTDERVREKFHECPMCCYDCDCTQGKAGGLCLHCNDPLGAETNTEDVSTIANDAATRMYDRCVQELKNLIDAEQNKHPSAHVAVRRMALHDAITALESLTLEQGEQEKR